jgi:hypothetical protein
MVWSVAARYGFNEAEIMGMSMSRLRYWYKGHQYMAREEQTARDRILSMATGKAVNG